VLSDDSFENRFKTVVPVRITIVIEGMTAAKRIPVSRALRTNPTIKATMK